jgi:hypothetical protein
MLGRQLQADAVATREQQRRARTLEVICRAYGVDDVLPVAPQRRKLCAANPLFLP